jgi:hypothetical protein
LNARIEIITGIRASEALMDSKGEYTVAWQMPGGHVPEMQSRHI